MGRGPRRGVVPATRLRDRGTKLALFARRTRRRGASRPSRGRVRGEGTCRRPLGHGARGGVCAQATAHPACHGRDARIVWPSRGSVAFRRRRRHGHPTRGGHRCVLTVCEGSIAPSVPTAAVPVATQIGCIARHRHDVAGSRADRAVATGADIVLRGLVRLHPSHLDRSVEAVPESGCSSLRRHGVTRRTPRRRARDSLRSPSPRRRCRSVASLGAVAGRIPW